MLIISHTLLLPTAIRYIEKGLNHINGDSPRVNSIIIHVLVPLQTGGLLVDEEKQHKEEETLGEQVPRGVVDKLQVEYVLRRDYRQSLRTKKKNTGQK